MTRRARAIAIALRRRPEPSPWLMWLVLALLLLVGVTAHGQSMVQSGQAAPQASGSGTTQTVPVTPVPAAPSGGYSGVLRPTVPVDPGIHAPAPAPSSFPMPVIKPPGTPGGTQAVIPK